eukprot:GEMP01014902.1.p1 GENE.GEMP01014902.1~~GEMP01014902.1.p1  ORF type:complete len:412 (+),score=74.61 GEMP01014902.1:50-1285(+)
MAMDVTREALVCAFGPINEHIYADFICEVVSHPSSQSRSSGTLVVTEEWILFYGYRCGNFRISFQDMEQIEVVHSKMLASSHKLIISVEHAIMEPITFRCFSSERQFNECCQLVKSLSRQSRPAFHEPEEEDAGECVAIATIQGNGPTNHNVNGSEIVAIQMPMTTNKFFEMFIGDEAKLRLWDVPTKAGLCIAETLVAQPWTEEHRMVEYFAPTGSSFAPHPCKVAHEQKYSFSEDNLGFEMTSEIKCPEVPYGDTFSVALTIRTEEDTETKLLAVRFWCSVVIIKRTMMSNVISGLAIDNYRFWGNKWVEMATPLVIGNVPVPGKAKPKLMRVDDYQYINQLSDFMNFFKCKRRAMVKMTLYNSLFIPIGVVGFSLYILMAALLLMLIYEVRELRTAIVTSNQFALGVS